MNVVDCSLTWADDEHDHQYLKRVHGSIAGVNTAIGSRFDTMPSSPSLQACSKTNGPSSWSRCSLNRMPWAARARMRSSVAFRTASGSQMVELIKSISATQPYVRFRQLRTCRYHQYTTARLTASVVLPTPPCSRGPHLPRANIINSNIPPTTHTQGGTRDSHPELDGTGGGDCL